MIRTQKIGAKNVPTIDLERPDWHEKDPIFGSTPGGRIEIYHLSVDDVADPLPKRWRAVLSDEEDEMVESYLQKRDRRRHAIGRVFLRLICAEQIGASPEHVSMAEGSCGKPKICGDGPLFNLTYSGDSILVAVSLDIQLGVDLESANQPDVELESAQTVLTEPEQSRLAAVEDEHRRLLLLHFWTCKEAVSKATGEGLVRPPDTIELTFDNTTATGVCRLSDGETEFGSFDAGDWCLHPFSMKNDRVGAVAYYSPDAEEISFRWHQIDDLAQCGFSM